MATIKGGDCGKAYLKRLARNLGNPRLKVGFLEGATYPDGTSVALVAAAQNFGTHRIPKRPFFSNMIAEKAGGWPRALELNLKATGYDGLLSLERVGEGIKGQLQQSIRDTNAPPLAESTIDRKGFDKPLIDTAHMINSAAWEVITR